MPPSAMRAAGFTLIELMIVVVIISILAVVGGTAYKRYGSRARSSEVYAMFGEFRAKEEAYRAEFSAYCNTSTTNCATAVGDTTYFPVLFPNGEPLPKAATSAVWPATWTSLGIAPGKDTLYCGYNVVAGTAATYASATPRGQKILAGGGAAPTGAWWYANATCDMDGTVTTPNMTFLTAGNTTTVYTEYEGQ